MIPILMFVVLFLSFVLIKAADMVVIAIRRLSKNSSAESYGISLFILAIATSFPELSVGITAALESAPSISLGDVTGSNIANIALVGGLGSVIVGRVRVHSEYLRRDVGIALLAGVMPLFLLLDGNLTRVDGLVLLAVYFAYATSFFRKRYVQIGKEQQEENFVYRFMRQFNHIDAARRREMGRLFAGVALLLFSADCIVKVAIYIASLAGLTEMVVGLVVVAIGTSLPELAFSFRSLGDREPSMFFGNLLGSTIANSTLIVGVVSVIEPIELIALDKFSFASGMFLLVFLAFWFFIQTKHRLDRWEGGMLLALYVIFVLIEFL